MNFLKQVLLYFIFLSLLYLLVDYLIFPSYTRHNKEFDLADLSEVSIDDAKKTLLESEMELIVSDSAFSSIVPEGHIISQLPKAFSRVKLGRRVYVTISKGIKPSVVPNLKGLSMKDAQFKLLARGLELKKLSYAFSKRYPANVVMWQSVEAGTEISVGDSISIQVSQGMDYKTLKIPNYVERQFKSAKKELQRFGLLVKKERIDANADYISGTILRQSIPAGTVLEGQSEITLWVVD